MNRFIRPVLIDNSMSSLVKGYNFINNLDINELNKRLMISGICPINLCNNNICGINSSLKMFDNLKIIYITSPENNYLIKKKIKTNQILYVGLDDLIDRNITNTIFNQRPNMAINIINSFIKNNPVHLCIDMEAFDSNTTPLCLFKDKLDFINFKDYYSDLKINVKNIDLIGVNSKNKEISSELFTCITKDFEFV
jgi:hypothetical protein